MIYLPLLISLLFGYLLGSFNTSVIVSRMKGEDIRTKGSGNAGATNTLRVMGKKAAIVVLLFDILKAVAAVLLIRAYFSYASGYDPFIVKMCELLGGFGAILGHNYPLYFGFRGGKGVATSIGTIAILDWRIALIVFAVFLIVLVVSRYVSLSSCMGALAAPIAAVFLVETVWEMVIFGLMGALCIYRHKENLRRLASGSEHKLGEKKKEDRA